MANKHLFFLIATVFWAIMGLQSWAITDELEVQALEDLYRSLNSPMQLEHWKSEGGDPCGETWIGVQCSGSSIINLKLHGLRLSGNLGLQLSNIKSLKHLDLSANNIEGSISYNLPPNLTNLNLAENKFSQSIPYSIEKMKHLRHLNLSHNFLTGPLGDVFNGLENLKLMDLSFNSFTGDLPTSFGSLTNLTGLFLQNNQFTGSVIFLANLSLSTLNIEDNHFSGVIPEHFQTIPNLRIGGNKFHTGPNYPPWRFPSDPMPTEQNISSPPATNLSAFESHPSQIIQVHNKKKSHAAGIVLLIGGVTLIAAFGALAVIFHRQRARRKILRSMEGSEDSMRSLPLSIIEEQKFFDVIKNASRLRHPNIVTLVGFCMEHGHHLIVYEYIRNLSLDEALHCVAYKPQSWVLRLRIALGVARALNYIHSSFVPPVAHSNLKAANILLDEELMPRVCDCGLAILRPLASNPVKLKASEMAIADSGYIAPEHFQPGNGNTKADVYAFGVVLLELLTGRKSFDKLSLSYFPQFCSSRPKAEQSLVRWASSRLHDSASLGQMVDPAITRTISSKSLSHFADIVSLSVFEMHDQPEQKFRPPMSEIVESLMSLIQRPIDADGTEADPLNRSFRSSNSHFFGSPTISNYSV